MKKIAKALLLTTTVLVVTPSYADFGSLLGKKSSKPSSNAYSMQDKLVKTYLSSAANINNAQLLLAEAFGLKDTVTKLEAEKEALSSGSVSDEDSIEKNKEVSEEANKAIQEKIKSGAKLSADGKKSYIKSFIPYIKGLVGGKSVVTESKPFLESAKSTISNASFTDTLSVTNKLKSGTFVATTMPSYVQSLWETSKLMLTYAKDNKIDVPDDATDSVSDMF